MSIYSDIGNRMMFISTIISGAKDLAPRASEARKKPESKTIASSIPEPDVFLERAIVHIRAIATESVTPPEIKDKVIQAALSSIPKPFWGTFLDSLGKELGAAVVGGPSAQAIKKPLRSL